MYQSGSLAGIPGLKRKFRVGATIVANQVVCKQGIAGPGEIASPPSGVENYADVVGCSLEAATYAVASPHVFALCTYGPFQIIRGLASGGATASTAFTAAQILTTTGSSATVFSDAAVGTLDYSGGLMIVLTGTYAGHIRVLASQSDSTSMTVTVPFPGVLAIGDKALRTYNTLQKGVELTTDFTQFVNLLAGTEALGDALGNSVILDVYVDGQCCSQTNGIQILNPTAPTVEFDAVFYDHIFNPID